MASNEFEEGQIVLCIVDKIIGTTVFVKIDGDIEGTLTTSEISPGRIRNLRDYVIPGKKIVCKILNIRGDKIHLSLRRVKQNERKELLDKISKEKSYKAILKTILNENLDNIINKIEEEYSLTELFEQLKNDSNILERFMPKLEAEKILKIFELKKEKSKEIRTIIALSNDSSEGIKIVKNILHESSKESKCDISYIAAGKYRLSMTGNDFKEIKNNMNKVLENIEKSAKKEDCNFEILKS